MVTTEEVNLDALLTQLSSDQVRANLISSLVGRIDISEEQIKRTIDFYVKAENFAEAAGVAADAGMPERAQGLYARAIDLYEKEGDFVAAAGVAEGAATPAASAKFSAFT